MREVAMAAISRYSRASGQNTIIERFGMINTGNPKQSDILLVTGPVTKRSRERLVEIYAQMPERKSW
jgi:Ni,Fe-hydrogenase III small subunit